MFTKAQPTPAYAIEVDGLCKNYPSFSLQDVSLHLESGSIMGFIGENGAGKSTTIKAILGLLHTDSGRIRLFGEDAAANGRRLKEDIGVVFDECHFHDTLTAKLIGTFMKGIYHNWDMSVYLDYLRRFSLPADKMVKELSRGMKMKLAIACALSHRPKLLILDEATSGLDPVVRNEILDVFLDFIQDESHSILLSSHITSDLDKIADYITLIHQGKILFSRSKDDLLENHTLLRCGADQLTQIAPEDIVAVNRNRFGADVLLKLSANHPRYAGFTKDKVTLEDIMLFYTKEEQ